MTREDRARVTLRRRGPRPGPPSTRRRAHAARPVHRPWPALLLLALAACGNGLGNDGCFGRGGLAPRPFDRGYDVAYAVALDADGDIIVAGTHYESPHPVAFAVVRYGPDGDLDASFGDGGATLLYPGEGGARAQRLALQPDGRILVGGTATTPGETARDDLALVRLDADGSVDHTFADDGLFRYADPSGENLDLWSLLVLDDGRVLLVGATGSSNVLLRLEPDGALDGSFGDGGVLEPALGEGARFTGNALEDGDRILVAGEVALDDGPRPALFCLGADGALVPAFGEGGVAIGSRDEPGAGGALADVARTPEGALVAVGGDRVFGFTAAGEVNEAFSGDGATEFDVTGWWEEPPWNLAGPANRALAIDSSGATTVVGDVFNSLYGSSPGLVARLRPDGEPDADFGEDGLLSVQIGTDENRLYDVALDAAGRAIVVGCYADDIEEDGSTYTTRMLVTRYAF